MEENRPAAGGVLKILFLTLFLDLVGFSIIFPLFPAMLEHYLAHSAEGALIHWTVEGLTRFASWLGMDGPTRITVLFGGLLTFLYSLLQFLAAPLAGWLSDRYGRRPVLLFSVGGMALSYALWIFAGSFALLVLSRLIGGLMGSNITTASAAVADVTGRKERSRGMAIIGMAFGLGFILGPAMGGLSARLDLAALFPSVPGLNPFSTPALLAFCLTLLNLLQIHFRLPETRRPDSSSPRRSINPLALLRPVKYPGVSTNNLAYFFFLLAFSGAEFTLTFLAAERLGYSPAQNGLLFVYIGLLLAGVQGGYVRRRAPIVGERRMAFRGLLLLAAGMGATAFAASTPSLLLAMALVSVGSGMVMPCLTALVSLYTPADDQGRMLGIFRSLGALARTLGPIPASLLYWKLGPGSPWGLGALSLLLPLLLIQRLPEPAREGETQAG